MTAKAGTRKLLRLRNALNEEINRLQANKGWVVKVEVHDGPFLDITVDDPKMDTGDGKD